MARIEEEKTMNKKCTCAIIRPYGVTLIAVLSILSLCPAPGFGETPFIFSGVADSDPLIIGADEAGITGIFPDLFAEISQRTGLEIRIKLYPFARGYQYLKTGRVDGITALYYTKEREQYAIYSELPLVTLQDMIFVKKGRKFEFHTIRDLYGKTLGKMRGWHVSNDELRRAIEDRKIGIDEGNTYSQNLLKLITGRTDGFIGTNYQTLAAAKKMGVADQISMLETPVADELKTFCAISKKSPKITDQSAFMHQLDAAFKDIRADGAYEKILSKYLGAYRGGRH